MTHHEIMAQSETIGDYISYALANGWQKVHICENLSREYPVNCWSVISRLVNEYMTDYAVGAVEVNLSAKPEEGYESITEAAKALGMTYKQYYRMKRVGRKVYIIGRKEYGSRTELMTAENLAKKDYDKMMRAGEIRAERVFNV